MVEEIELLRKTIGASEIKRVAIVDDVFDTPAIGQNDMGACLEFLQNGEAARAYAKIEQSIWASAIADIGNGEHDSTNVAEVLEKLYEKYVNTGDGKCDPAGLFSRTRDANLQYLRPLLELLASCDSLVVHRFGSATPTIGEDEMPDLVLVDLFLNPAISPVVHPEEVAAQAAATQSMERVRPLLKKDPAVILMSSHGEKGQQEADKYRGKLSDRVYASRFAFVDKGQIKKDPKHGLRVDLISNQPQ